MSCWCFNCLSWFMSSKYAWSDYFFWSYSIFIYEYEVSSSGSCKYWYSISFSRIPIDEKICILSSSKFIDTFMNLSITIISDDLIWNFFHKLDVKNISLFKSSTLLTFFDTKRFYLIPGDSLKLGETHENFHKICNFLRISLAFYYFLSLFNDFFQEKWEKFFSIFRKSYPCLFSFGLDDLRYFVANKFSHISLHQNRKKDQTIISGLGVQRIWTVPPKLFSSSERNTLWLSFSRIPTLDRSLFLRSKIIVIVVCTIFLSRRGK